MPKRKDGLPPSFEDREYEHGRERTARDYPAWRAVQERKAAMPLLEEERFDPGPPLAALLRPGSAVLLGGDAEHVRVSRWRPHLEDSPSGFVGDAFELACDEPFTASTFVVRLDVKAFVRVSPSSVRFFRHEREGGSYALCVASGLGSTGDYLWARVGVPGFYAAIGLDSDPLFLTVLEVLASTRPLVLTEPLEQRRKRLVAVVESVLETPLAERWLAGDRNGGALSRAVERRGLPAGFFDQEREPVSREQLKVLAERCGGEHEPPELQLLQVLRDRGEP